MLQLSSAERRALRARAHGLDPVVTIAENGLSAAVLKEIDLSLAAHELIKIRVQGDDRARREAYLVEVCAVLHAAPVQHIGKLLVVWRPRPADAAAAAATPAKKRPARRPARAKKRDYQ
jgi:putative YhbY family RNA-binding protein